MRGKDQHLSGGGGGLSVWLCCLRLSALFTLIFIYVFLPLFCCILLFNLQTCALTWPPGATFTDTRQRRESISPAVAALRLPESAFN